MMIRFARILFLISLALAGGAYALYSFPVLTIKEITIIGSDRINADALALTRGMNLFSADLEELVSILRAHRFVECASARCDLQGNLLINVTEKQPIAYLYDGQLYAVSKWCELLPLASKNGVASLPVIRGVAVDTILPYAQIKNPSLHAAIRFLAVMRETNAPYVGRLSEIILLRETMKLIFEPGSVVVNVGWGNYEKKAEILERILSANKNPGLDLDLRLVDLAVMKTRIVHNKDSEVNNGI